MSLDLPRRSICLLQTDRTSEDRLRDKHVTCYIPHAGLPILCQIFKVLDFDADPK